MKLCKVLGSADSSIKDAGLEGAKLLVLQEVDATITPSGRLLLAVDTTGAGVGEIVAVVTGGSAVRSVGSGEMRFDAVVVAIMDHVYINGNESYSKSEEA